VRVRSTGLGRTEMELDQESLSVRNGYLLLSLRSTKPVRWHIRILMDRGDVLRFGLSLLKGAIFTWIISLFKKPSTPPEY